MDASSPGSGRTRGAGHMDEKSLYRISVRGTVPPGWCDRLGGMRVEFEGDDDGPVTTLVGELRDQAALAGVLNTLYQLHLPIQHVSREVSSDETADPTGSPSGDR